MTGNDDHLHWPHAPPHWTFEQGIYFVTASTYHRERLFDKPVLLDAVRNALMKSAPDFGWTVRAWVILSNHYHMLAQSPEGTAESLRLWLREFHRSAAIEANRICDTPGRRVWMNFRDTRITLPTSYLARLNYIHQNPVHHGIVPVADQYRWSSVGWFERHAAPGFIESVRRFKTDKVNVWDDF